MTYLIVKIIIKKRKFIENALNVLQLQNNYFKLFNKNFLFCF